MTPKSIYQLSTHGNRRAIFPITVVLAATLNLIYVPSTRGNTITYNVAHTFTFAPGGGVTSLPSYVFGVSTQALPGGTPDSNSGSVALGSGGTSSQSAGSTGSLSSATAGSFATLEPFTIGGPISGVIGSDGSIVVVPGGTCCAISSAAVVLDGGSSATHGSADYGPDMAMGEGGGGGGVGEGEQSAAEHDPIDFQVTDLTTGAITTGTLFSVSSDLQGVGSWSWGSGMFTLNASDFDFSIGMNSPFTVQQGAADLQVRNGIITASDGTGMFAGIFPAVGTAGNFSVPFNTNISVDYNLGNFNGDPVDVRFTLSDSGSACAVPEPATILPGLAALLLLVGGVVRRGRRRLQWR